MTNKDRFATAENPGDATDSRLRFSWDDHFLGSVTVGDRGQIVVPLEARKRCGIEPGDRLLVMAGLSRKSIMLCRMDDLREFMGSFQEALERIEREKSSAHAQNPGDSEGEKR